MGLESIKIRLPWEKEDTMEKVQNLVWKKSHQQPLLTKLFIGSCCKASLTCNYQHEFMSMIPISRVKVVRHLPMTYIYLNKNYCLKDIKTKKIPK